MAADKEVEVRTKLTLDDNAASSLSKFTHGMQEANQATKQTQMSANSFVRSTLSTLVAVNLAPFIGQIKQVAMSFVHAAEADEMVSRKFAALEMAMNNVPWADAIKKGGELNNELDNLAIKTGTAGDGLNYAYERMTEITGSTKQAKESLEPLANLASAMGKNVGTLAQEFGFMSEGMLRTRGPLFNLLKDTGIFHKETKKAAAEWSKLTEKSRGELLAHALTKMNEKVKTIPPSMESMVTSVKEMWNVAKETVGGPIVKELHHAMEKAKGFFTSHRKEFEKLAETLGTQIGVWVKEAAHAFEHGLEWIKDHQEEIKNALVDGMKKVKEIVEWILKHKEELAMAFGAKTLGPSLLSGASAAGGAIGSVYKAGAAGGSMGGASGGVGGALALGWLTLAIAGVGMAAEQSSKLIEEWKGGFFSGMYEAYKSLLTGEKITDKYADALAREKAIKEALAKGEVERADQLIAKMKEVGDAHATLLQKQSDQAKGTATFQAAQAMGENYKTAMRAGGAMGLGAEKHAALVDKSAPVEGLASIYNAAVQANDTAAQVYVANLIANSSYLTKKFMESSALIAGGLEGMAKNVTESGSVAAQKFLEWAKDPLLQKALPTGESTKAKGMPAKVNIGNATFNIKQEFRDQDPDRVALVFQRDITRAAINKTASGRAPFFGA